MPLDHSFPSTRTRCLWDGLASQTIKPQTPPAGNHVNTFTFSLLIYPPFLLYHLLGLRQLHACHASLSSFICWYGVKWCFLCEWGGEGITPFSYIVFMHGVMSCMLPAYRSDVIPLSVFHLLLECCRRYREGIYAIYSSFVMHTKQYYC